MLARGLAQGQLHLPWQPAPEMLALPNPWDPDQNGKWRLHDAVLFNGRYYIYHGVAPAIVLFVPWRLLTGFDLPETFAVALMLFLTYLFWCATCLRLLNRMGRPPGPFLIAVFALALGVCNTGPFLINRVWVYEIAIAGGAMFLAAGFLALTFQNRWALATAGVMFGLAVGSRPHLALAGAIVFVVLLWRREPLKNLLAYTAAIGAVGCALAWYNYARFGNPFEFGVRYMLAGSLSHQEIKIRAATLPTGLYYFLISPPQFSAVFPFVRLHLHWPFHAGSYDFAAGYYLEATAGMVFLSPFVAFALFIRRHWVWIAIFASGIAILLFVCATGFTTQRYALDFAPLMTAAAVVALPKRLWAQLLFTVLVVCSVVANLAIGIAGPYDDILTNRPRSYLRLARWFGPTPEHRITDKLSFDIELRASAKKVYTGFREPLITGGYFVRTIRVYLEHTETVPRLVSEADGNTAHFDLRKYEEPAVIRIQYDPTAKTVTAAVNGQPAIEQKNVTLIFAPSQLVIGKNEFGSGSMFESFTGSLETLRRDVRYD
jgi:hypothetical protein